MGFRVWGFRFRAGALLRNKRYGIRVPYPDCGNLASTSMYSVQVSPDHWQQVYQLRRVYLSPLGSAHLKSREVKFIVEQWQVTASRWLSLLYCICRKSPQLKRLSCGAPRLQAALAATATRSGTDPGLNRLHYMRRIQGSSHSYKGQAFHPVVSTLSPITLEHGALNSILPLIYRNPL